MQGLEKKMIEIKIKINRNKQMVFDQLYDKDCTLQEVSLALFRLKQIEHELIQKEFKDEYILMEEEHE